MLRTKKIIMVCFYVLFHAGNSIALWDGLVCSLSAGLLAIVGKIFKFCRQVGQADN